MGKTRIGLNIDAFKVGSQDCRIYLGSELVYPEEAHDYSTDYLTFVALGNTCYFNFDQVGYGNIYYSLDNGSTWILKTDVTAIQVHYGDKILWKGNLVPKTAMSFGIGTFIVFNGDFIVQGNVMSLLYSDNFVGQTSLSGKTYVFYQLFSHCGRLLNAENLILPATTLSSYCYWGMFADCTSLTTAPSLPSKRLANSCYEWMFEGCTSLNYIKCLATNISADYCTDDWVSGVASNGTFVKAASMTSWPTGTSGIPSGWTVENA